jgi:hypothetical protein
MEEPIVETVQKPKRILTEAQLLALKKGREALAEKRRVQKDNPKEDKPKEDKPNEDKPKEESKEDIPEEEYPGFCTIT